MKKILIALVLITAYACSSEQSPKIKELKPEVRPLKLSQEEAALFDKWQEIVSKNSQEWTKEEEVFAEKYEMVFSEDMESYWQTPSGGGGCSWYCGGGPSLVMASSELKTQGSASYEAKHAHDFSYGNVWAEGVEGYGIGEYLLYKFPKNSPRVNKIIIANGHVKSEKAWKENSRVKKLKMYVDGKPYAILNLDDSRSEQTFELGEALGEIDSDKGYDEEDQNGLALKFEILEVYKGEKYDDTVISELYFDGLDVHCFGAGTKIKMADGTELNIEALKVGDVVAAYDMNSGKQKSATVEAVDAASHQLYLYTFKSGKTIEATSDHPFLLKGKSWASLAPEKSKIYKGFESIQKIEVGDVFVTADGEDELVATQLIATAERMSYTITLLKDATSFIANGFVVGVEEM